MTTHHNYRTLRQAVYDLLEELRRHHPEHTLLKFQSMVDETTETSSSTAEEFNVYFVRPLKHYGKLNGVTMLEALRETVLANLDEYRTTPTLTPVLDHDNHNQPPEGI